MLTFLVRRAATLVVTLLVVSVLAFLIPYAGEGDAARKILRARTNDPALDPAQVEALTKELGLDRPIYVQYLDWLRDVVTGDFGFSFTSRTPVQELVAAGADGVDLLGPGGATAGSGHRASAGDLGRHPAGKQGRQRGHVHLPERGLGTGVLGGPGAGAGLRPLPGMAALGWLERVGLHHHAGHGPGSAATWLLHAGDPGGDERRAGRAVHHRRAEPGAELPADAGAARSAQQHAAGDDALLLLVRGSARRLGGHRGDLQHPWHGPVALHVGAEQRRPRHPGRV